MEKSKAPELIISEWINTKKPLTIENQVKKNKVIVIYAFQMLCPGCVSHSIPQSKIVHEFFADKGVVVIGLHTVFEHHEAMTAISLKAFLHENRVLFPVGIDAPSEDMNDPIPKTMRTYNMQGTPTLLLIDKKGNLRKQTFGLVHDLQLGAEIMALLKEN